MARRVLPLIVVVLFAVTVLSVLPGAEASHAHGHRFMIHGQILDAEGNPAQLMPVTMSAQSQAQGSAMDPHPQMTVETDCNGFYYSQTDRQRPGDTGLDAGRLHLHPAFGNPQLAWASNPDYWIATPYAEYREDALTPMSPLSEAQMREYAVHIGKADHRGSQVSHVNIQLDAVVEPHPACEGVDSESTLIVAGKVQVIESDGTRVDQVTIEGFRTPQEVTVTVSTPDGDETMTVTTDAAAMYRAVFENITVQPGSQITAKWGDNTKRDSVPEGFNSASVDIIVREWFWQSTGFQVFAGIVGVIVLAGGAVWMGTRIKDRAETKKAMSQSTRKRANR